MDVGEEDPGAGVTGDITGLLTRAQRGDAAACDALYGLVEPVLRSLALRRLGRHGHQPLWQPTAIIDDAFLKLVEQRDVQWQDRSHFGRVAAIVMRRVVTDWARREARACRDAQRVAASDVHLLTAPTALHPDALLDLDVALEELARIRPRAARLVELRFYAGMAMADAAEVLGVSASTADAEWQLARTLLHEKLDGC